ncbi:hypothetical protein N2152v2_008015 [Parachlorella kessleri]
MQLFVRAAYAQPCLISTEATASVAAVCHAYTKYQELDDLQLRVVYEGRTLDGHSSLEEAGVAQYGTLELLPRLRGGGGDGGSTGAESRTCYLEMYLGKKPDKVNPEEERLARWTTCQLTGMPLQPPCVCDELGSLYNKDAVIQALVGKTMPKALSHISSLKHVMDLKLEPSADAAANGGSSSIAGAGGSAAVRFACPISGQPMNGKYKFVVVRRTGHVLSERAVKEVPQVVEELVGFKPGAADLLAVNPPAEELLELREKLLEQRAAARAAKKDGKKASKAAAPAVGAAVGEKRAAAAEARSGNGALAAAAAAGALYGGEAARNGTVTAIEASSNGVLKGGESAAGAAAKKFKATELMPSHADKKVWESLFTSSRKGEGKETYLCRSTAARGMHLS